MSSRYDSTRWSIVLGAAARDPASRDEFVARYDRVVRAYFAARWRLPTADERVANSVQDTFFEFLKPNGALDRVDPQHPGGFRAFLFGVTVRVAADADRKRHRRPEQTGADLDQFENSAESASAAFDRAWATMVIDEALDSMTAQDGEVAHQRMAALQMRYYDQLAPREIAARTGYDVKQVYRLLETGRAHFRVAILQVMSKYHPDDSQAELERRCQELLEFS